jgi:hypothetical protein
MKLCHFIYNLPYVLMQFYKDKYYISCYHYEKLNMYGFEILIELAHLGTV